MDRKLNLRDLLLRDLKLLLLRRRSPDPLDLASDPVGIVGELHANSGNTRKELRVVDGGGGAVEGEKGDESREERCGG